MSKNDTAIILAGMLGLCVLVGALSLVPLTLMWAWNAFVVTVAGLAPLTYFQAVAGVVLIITAVLLLRALRSNQSV